MDENQLRTLQRKRHIIAINIHLDGSVIDELKRRGLITDEMLEGMKVTVASEGHCFESSYSSFTFQQYFASTWVCLPRTLKVQ